MKIIKGGGFSLCVSVEDSMVFMERRLLEPLDSEGLSRVCAKFGVELLDEEECPAELVADDVILVWGCFANGSPPDEKGIDMNAA